MVCVDELAHTNVPGSRHEKRAEDVEQIRAAGIDVITTVNIQHLESLNDEVERITGVRQRETVPDEVVRTADQIQLVDMSPDALRRRMAHGNIYRPEQVDASLTSYFRVGNLTALRELALLWLADRVDDALGDYRRAHQIEAPWPAKERIVVAVTGGAESETLLRRGARLAQRAAGSELLAVHVIVERRPRQPRRDPDRPGPAAGRVARRHLPLGRRGGRLGRGGRLRDRRQRDDDRRRRLPARPAAPPLHRDDGRPDRLARRVDRRPPRHPRRGRPAPPGRGGTSRRSAGSARSSAWRSRVLLPVLLTVRAATLDDPDQLPLDVLLFLAVTVLVALVGGLVPALVAALGGFLLMNWFFTPPVRRLTISDPANLVALLVFVAVAIGVATVVDRASRRATDAVRARTEAATMGSLSRSVLTGQDTAEAIVGRLREVFGQDVRVAAGPRGRPGWTVVAVQRRARRPARPTRATPGCRSTTTT